MEDFDVRGSISSIETIAEGNAIRDLPRSQGRTAQVGGESAKASRQSSWLPGPYIAYELHWYEAHGIGRKELKIKRYLE